MWSSTGFRRIGTIIAPRLARAATSLRRARSLRRLLVELDEAEDVLPDQAADRARAVLRDHDRLVGLHDEAGGLEDSSSLLIESAQRRCGLLHRKPVADRERQGVLAYGL